MEHMDRDGIRQDCNDGIERCVQTVLAQGGKASMTIKIEVSRRGTNQVILAGGVDVKLPKAKPMPITLFAKTNGELHVTNPDQAEFAEVVRITDHKPTVVINGQEKAASAQ